ncbi:entry exclusion lipoprotein TrbK [Duganella sp. 1224]|uniref:entry exclusion lipoprotein TrbK n=1 Tax=Duganella sp. 1224 TaxID=2587052 RepID=UPI0015C7EFE5|nr:entry exclusion lipoprotein TrbK [Duganella sp. 1224]NYE60578.1 entry exclusion lipoprotein TrbK [Duganella sp. 1224]
MKLNAVLLAVAAVALVFTGYKELNRKPQPHPVNDGACTQEAIKNIDNITERAIQSSRCAQRDK